MTNKQRFRQVLSGQLPPDRLPIIEWSVWWDKTIHCWEQQGNYDFHYLENPDHFWNEDSQQLFDLWKLDRHLQIWATAKGPGCPAPSGHGKPRIRSMEEYLAVQKSVCSDALVSRYEEQAKRIRRDYHPEETPVSLILEGFFWHPREMLGIEEHLYAFYDEPELMHRLNEDLLQFNKKVIERVCNTIEVDHICIAEDMSYNHGAMLSKQSYDEFLLPYYRELVPWAKSFRTVVTLDTDGNVEPLIPWYLQAGIQGVTPLERMSGVDVVRIMQTYENFYAIGGFDKTVMSMDEAAMRREFERIYPAMKTGRYIVSCDHQTPPQVDLEHYRLYRALLEEYCRKACEREDEPASAPVNT